jgi:hypothetical protein
LVRLVRVPFRRVHKIQIEAQPAQVGRIVIGTITIAILLDLDLFFRSRGGALGSNTIVQNDDLVGSLFFQGADGTDINSRAAKFPQL